MVGKMKNQPARGDCLIYALGFCAAGVAYFWIIAPELRPLIVSGAGTVSILFVASAIGWLCTRTSEHAEIEESGDITTFTWALANRVGPQKAYALRNQVAEEKYPGTNHGIMTWRPGYNLHKFQNLAARELGVNVEIQTADEVVKGSKGW
jgi:hypothetical protein